MDPEQAVKDFIAKVKALEGMPLKSFTQEDINEVWEIWGNVAQWIKKGGHKPPNLMEGRRWAGRLEKLEQKIVKLY